VCFQWRLDYGHIQIELGIGVKRTTCWDTVREPKELAVADRRECGGVLPWGALNYGHIHFEMDMRLRFAASV